MFTEKGVAELIDEETPLCEADSILCQTLYSGLSNGTERNVLIGGNYGGSWPNRCGYQNVGRIIEVGSDVQGYAAGELVFCADYPQHRQIFTAKTNDWNLLVKIPGSLDPKTVPLLGVAGVAFHDVRTASVAPGEKVLVVGAGLIGQFTAQAARAAGAELTVCDLNNERLAIAKQLGAPQTVVPDENWDNVKNLGPFDCVFEDSGAPVLDFIIGNSWGRSLIKTGGRLVLIAGRSGVEYNLNAAQSCDLCIIHTSHFLIDDLKHVFRLAEKGTIRTEPLIKEVVPFIDITAIYNRLRDNPASLLGVVFDWQ